MVCGIEFIFHFTTFKWVFFLEVAVVHVRLDCLESFLSCTVDSINIFEVVTTDQVLKGFGLDDFAFTFVICRQICLFEADNAPSFILLYMFDEHMWIGHLSISWSLYFDLSHKLHARWIYEISVIGWWEGQSTAIWGDARSDNVIKVKNCLYQWHSIFLLFQIL
jgi:hypothetical protein